MKRKVARMKTTANPEKIVVPLETMRKKPEFVIRRKVERWESMLLLQGALRSGG
jgi:hypothetical protein